jgi:hypothetical protein
MIGKLGLSVLNSLKISIHACAMVITFVLDVGIDRSNVRLFMGS